MCIICVDYQKQLISITEARNILTETWYSMDPEHLEELERMLNEDELNGSED